MAPGIEPAGAAAFSMEKQEIIEREARYGRMAGILGLIGIVLFLLSSVLGLAPDFNEAEDLKDRLPLFDAESGEILLQRVIQATGLLLFIPPMLYLFLATAARQPKFRQSLIGLCFAGPIFLAASIIVNYFAIDSAAMEFTQATDLPTDPDALEDEAEDILSDQGATQVGGGLGFAGILGFVFIMIYTSLNAMRIGLLTRFMGTLTMALAVGLLVLGFSTLLGYFVVVSLLIAGWWSGGLPPAWEAGEARPWDDDKGDDGDGEDEEELADPEQFTDIGSGEEPESRERPARRDNKRRRKRKQRGN